MPTSDCMFNFSCIQPTFSQLAERYISKKHCPPLPVCTCIQPTFSQLAERYFSKKHCPPLPVCSCIQPTFSQLATRWRAAHLFSSAYHYQLIRAVKNNKYCCSNLETMIYFSPICTLFLFRLIQIPKSKDKLKTWRRKKISILFYLVLYEAELC